MAQGCEVGLTAYGFESSRIEQLSPPSSGNHLDHQPACRRVQCRRVAQQRETPGRPLRSFSQKTQQTPSCLQPTLIYMCHHTTEYWHGEHSWCASPTAPIQHHHTPARAAIRAWLALKMSVQLVRMPCLLSTEMVFRPSRVMETLTIACLIYCWVCVCVGGWGWGAVV